MFNPNENLVHITPGKPHVLLSDVKKPGDGIKDDNLCMFGDFGVHASVKCTHVPLANISFDVAHVSNWLAIKSFFTEYWSGRLTPPTLHLDKFQFWLQLHGIGGAYNYAYDVKIDRVRPTENNFDYGNIRRITQTSRHNNRDAVISFVDPSQSTSAAIKQRDESYWGNMIVTLSKDEMEGLKWGYDYSGMSYMYKSESMRTFADKWHENSPQKFTYNDGIMAVHPARFRAFLDVLDKRFNGSFRIALHGTGAVGAIMGDVNGFNQALSYSETGGRLHGATFGKGIYLGFDASVSHSYNKSGKSGNVLLCMAGWDNSFTVPTPTSGVSQYAVNTNAFAINLFRLHSQLHWDGAVYKENGDIYITGELCASGNTPVSDSTSTGLTLRKTTVVIED